MSNSIDPQNQTLESQTPDQSPSERVQAAQPWETMARSWLAAMPEGKTVTPIEVEAWINSNHGYLPDEVKSMSLPMLFELFTSIQNSTGLSNEDKDANQVDPHHARFQRTDQWMPVYAWLESLDTDEVVKSKDILDWLSENPEVREHLYSRHSRYHLMHYIKKCHVKILKRKEKKKGLQPTNKANSTQLHKTGGTKLSVALPFTFAGSVLNNLPKDSDMYVAKRSEALRKYEILVELKRQLSTHFPKCGSDLNES